MQSLIVDIINSKALKLLQDLESLQLIRVRKENSKQHATVNWAAKYKGAMAKQSPADIDKQLNDLRNGNLLSL
ncbi:MAG: hypothetical protein K0Q79_456 [Flavipsychrobacter sp.]|jgi:hypothetical protein|nr:hypothetical protein [Flavipsychrobacter sp.]